MAGFFSRYSVEFDPKNEALSAKLANCYAENFPRNFTIRRSVQDMQKLNWIGLPKRRVVVASPVCANFSKENNNGGETEIDISSAIATASAIATLTPSVFVLEQVPAYEGSKSWAIITDALHADGYNVTSQVVDMKDYGIPQLLRKRLIAVASKGKQFVFPTPSNQCLSWWDAIADLELPDSQLLIKQKRAIEKFQGQEPLLVERVGNRGECKVFPATGLAPTLKKSIFTDEKGVNRKQFFDIAFTGDKASQLTKRAAARIQGIPDWWEPTCPAAIGYGVPSFFFYQLFTSIKNQLF
jgi:DNA (cytosine-5)-methyltransferase 1